MKVKYRLNGNFVKSAFSMIRCVNCGLIRVEPLLRQDVLLKIYDETYYQGYLSNVDNRKIYFKKVLNELSHLANKGKILDVGCGDGLFLDLAREAGWGTYGLEPSGVAESIANKQCGLNVFGGLLEKSNFKKGNFDIVTLFNVLHHMPDPVASISAIKELLTGDGLLMVELPNFRDIWYRYRCLEHALLRIDNLHIPNVIYWFDANTLHSMLNKAGFKVIDLKFINHNTIRPNSLKPEPPFINKAYFCYRDFIKRSCGFLSALSKGGDHIRVICKKGV